MLRFGSLRNSFIKSQRRGPVPRGSNDKKSGVPGNAEHKRKALNVLIAERFVSVKEGQRGAHLHSLVKPDRQAADPRWDR